VGGCGLDSSGSGQRPAAACQHAARNDWLTVIGHMGPIAICIMEM
jgi:hypothetical protein